MILSTPATAMDKINIFVSIPPQKFLVERVGGERVQVSVMVRPGQNPETYEPTPAQMAALHEADLYFRVAVPYESVWLDRIRALNPELTIIECCGPLSLADPAGHDLDPETGFSISDVHIWTSPENAIVLAGIVQTALQDFDPASGDYYAENYRALMQELQQLDQSIRNILAPVKNRYMVVAHPSWGHFAKAYDLEQIAIERHGVEMNARQLSRLIEFAREKDIRVIYVQRQFNSATARMLAEEIRASIIELDPLAENYVKNLLDTARAIREGAKKI
jgi:zinc transport system substrate-binding protein